MASILKVDALQGVTAAGSILVTGEGNSTTTNLQQGLAKAFAQVEADGSAVVTSLNTSSWSDGGTGIGLQNLTNAFSSANYSAIASAHCDLGSSLGGVGAINNQNTASAIDYRGTSASGARADPSNDYNLSTLGDLA